MDNNQDNIVEVESTESLGNGTPAPKKSAGLRILAFFFDYLEIFAISIITVLIIFTFCFRLCRVTGDSMNKTLFDGELLVTSDLFYEPEQNDIIVFHLSNNYYKESIVKRVIALEGQTVEINFTKGEVKVNGVLMDDSFVYLDDGSYDVRYDFNQNFIDTDGDEVIFRATVPEGKIFVMGDNRNGSSDSRSSRIGFVDKDCVIGKALFRISPFTTFD